MYKRIIVTGSLAFDHIMQMPDRFRDHIMPDKLHILNVSFLLTNFRQEYGGTAGNIAYSLALLKTPTAIFSVVGTDFAHYREHLSKLRIIDIKGIKVIRNSATSQGFVITDKEDNQIWGFYEGAMKKATRLSVNNFSSSNSFLVLAPNNPEAMVKFANQATKLKLPYMFDPAFNIPHFSKHDLLTAVKHSEILIGNDYEIELIARRLDMPKAKLLGAGKIIITTLGMHGSLIQKGNKKWKIPPAKPKNQSDPTGAGDNYRAGFLSGFVRGFPLDVCGKMGSVAAVYTVEKYGTQTHSYTMKAFCKRYQENFSSTLKLDKIPL